MIKGVMQGAKLRIRTPYKDQAEQAYKDEIGKLAHAPKEATTKCP